MSEIKKLLSNHNARIYVYLHDSEISARFLSNAENEGFTFCDGIKPTEKHTSDIIAVNRDGTLNYVGLIGRIAFQSADCIGDEKLIKLDYRDFVNC